MNNIYRKLDGGHMVAGRAPDSQRFLAAKQLVDAHMSDVPFLDDNKRRMYANTLAFSDDSCLNTVVSQNISRSIVEASDLIRAKASIEVRTGLNAKNQEKIRKMFPELNLQLRVNGNSSDHPVPAAANEIFTSTSMFKAGFKETAVDIGGNYVKRFTRKHYNVHCCCLDGDMRDKGRYVSNEENMAASYDDLKLKLYKIENGFLFSEKYFENQKKKNMSLASVSYEAYKQSKISEIRADLNFYKEFERTSVMNDLQARGAVAAKYRCFNDAAECDFPAKVLYAVDSGYDISMEKNGEIMDSHGADVMYGMMIMDISILQNSHGVIENLDCMYTINYEDDEIEFFFTDDSSFAYTHRWSTYKQYFFDTEIRTKKGNAYVYRVTKWRAGLIEYTVRRISGERCFEPGLSRDVYALFGGTRMVKINTWKVNYKANKKSSLCYEPITAFCPYELFDMNLKYAADVSRLEDMTRSRLHAYMRATNTYFVVNGRAIYTDEKIDLEYFEPVVTAILVLAFRQRYLQMHSMNIQMTTVKNRRERFELRGILRNVKDAIFRKVYSKFFMGLSSSLGIDAINKCYVEASTRDRDQLVQVMEKYDYEVFKVDTFASDYNVWKNYLGCVNSDYDEDDDDFYDRVCDYNDREVIDTCVLSDEDRKHVESFFSPVVEAPLEKEVVEIGSVESEEEVEETVFGQSSDDDEDEEVKQASSDGEEVDENTEYVTVLDKSQHRRIDSVIPYDASLNFHRGPGFLDSEDSVTFELTRLQERDFKAPDTLKKEVVTLAERKLEMCASLDEARRYFKYSSVVAKAGAVYHLKQQACKPLKQYIKNFQDNKTALNWMKLKGGVVTGFLLPTSNNTFMVAMNSKGQLLKVQISEDEAGNTVMKVDTQEKYLFVTADFVVYNGEQMYTAISRALSRLQESDYVVAKYHLDEGVPGCGKTYTLMMMFRSGYDIILCNGRENAKKIRVQMIATGVPEKIAQKYIRTLDSYILNPNVTAQRLLIDEALMPHDAVIHAAVILSGARECYMCGDRQQIPFINFSPSFRMTFANIFRYDSQRYNYVSRRCPASSVVAVSEEFYSGKMVTISETKATLKRQKIESIGQVPKFDKEKNKGASHIYLVFEQKDKEKLREVGLTPVKTIHEAQGETKDFIFVVRLAKNTPKLYSSACHVLVGMTRNTCDFTYYTCSTDFDYMSKLIKYANDKSCDAYKYVIPESEVQAYNDRANKI